MIEQKRLRLAPYVAPVAGAPASSGEAQVVAPALSFWPQDECVLSPPMPIAACSTVHREQLDPQLRDPVLELAMVARLVPWTEMYGNPRARDKLDFEWNRLRSHPTWDEEAPREWADVAQEARQQNNKIHFARLIELVYEKGSELEVDDANRDFRGRVVVNRAGSGLRVFVSKRNHSMCSAEGKPPPF